MEIKVLGRLSVSVGGSATVPTDQQVCRVLALLALNADQVVPTCLIAHELWPDGLLPRSDSQVVTHVAAVRALLAEALRHGHDRGTARTDGRDLLISTPGGYRLDSTGWQLDARRFERDLAAGYRAMAAGDPARASERLHDALSLWQGEALAGLPQGVPLRSHTARLEQARADAVEQWAAIELQLGRHRERLGELGELAARYPSHQGLQRHYIRALQRCGRSAEALRVYERLDAALRREGDAKMSLDLLRLRHRALSGGSRRVVAQREPLRVAAR
ncbi:AfsR/SARP family transcriptional regulator [Streptomyces mexicanus]|uniref:AfsR/SARP family transcriptional regulator n=1 Tax=Streptomyces mexicanus TaxID=178566 RepID=UPI003695ABA8